MNSVNKLFVILSLLPGLQALQAQCVYTIVNTLNQGCAPLEVIFNCPSANTGTMVWTMENIDKPGYTVSHIFQNPGLYIVTSTLVVQQSTTTSTCSASTTINVVTGPANGCSNTVVVGLKQSEAGTTVQVYPNPSKGDFEVNLNEDLESPRIILFNALGQQVHEEKLTKGVNNIRCNILDSGIYFLSIYDNQTRISGRRLVIE
jgi:hypothetical protein